MIVFVCEKMGRGWDRCVGRPGYYSGVAAFAFGEGAKLAPGHPASLALPPVFR